MEPVSFEVVPASPAAGHRRLRGDSPPTGTSPRPASSSPATWKDGTVDPIGRCSPAAPDPVVFYMGVTQLAAICEQLVAHGLPATTPAGCGVAPRARRRWSPPTSARCRGGQGGGIVPPALTIVGEVVGLQGASPGSSQERRRERPACPRAVRRGAGFGGRARRRSPRRWLAASPSGPTGAGVQVRAGFLDPQIHAVASGAPENNLDLGMCGEADAAWRLHRGHGEADLIPRRGVMGLLTASPRAPTSPAVSASR